MTDNVEAFERDLYWFEALVHTPVRLASYCAIALLIGHLSFGLQDFGITAWHLFAIWVVSTSLIWLTTNIAGRRLDVRVKRGMREAGFTAVETEELDPKERWWKI